jgi:hypothetical protein
MPLKYTGRSELHFPGDEKTYRNGDTVPISQADADRMAQRTNLHTFEEVAAPAQAAEPKPAPKADPKP